MVFGGQRSVSWFLRGDWELMVSTLVEAAAAFPRITAFDAATAAARVQLGDIETAAGQLAKAKERDFDTASVDAVWTTTLYLWTIVAIRTGDREAAARLHELLDQVTDRAIHNGASGYGAVDAYRALLAWELDRNEDAHALWKSGLALNEEMGLRSRTSTR